MKTLEPRLLAILQSAKIPESVMTKLGKKEVDTLQERLDTQGRTLEAERDAHARELRTERSRADALSKVGQSFREREILAASYESALFFAWI